MKTQTLAWLMIILLSCNNQKSLDQNVEGIKPYPHTINIKEGLENHVDIKLSEIADSIKYIILSKEKQILTKQFLYLQMSENDIFIQLGTLIHRFDKSGKFLNTIGHIGRGPEEYLGGSSFSINPASHKVYVYRNFILDFITYDFSGTYLGKVPLIFHNDIGSFECLSDSLFLIYPVYWGIVPKDMIVFGLFDQNGKKINALNHPLRNNLDNIDKSKFIFGGPQNPNTYFKNEIISKYYFDTIYKINGESISPIYYLDWENLARPEIYYYIARDPGKKYVNSPKKFLETPTKAFILVNDQINYNLVEYDKKSGKTSSMILPDKDNIGFINDLDGGTRFYPDWTNRNGDIWIKATEAIEFKKLHKTDLLPRISNINPEMREKLISFTNELQIDDNTVLELVYLKKNTFKYDK